MKQVGWALTSCMRLALGALITAFLTISAFAQSGDFYRLVPGDVVEVTVLEDPDLGRQLLVRPDGRVTMPLAGIETPYHDVSLSADVTGKAKKI